MADDDTKTAKATNKNVTNKQTKDKKPSQEIKLSVLESHGYTVGENIGSGSYAIVKVRIIYLI